MATFPTPWRHEQAPLSQRWIVRDSTGCNLADTTGYHAEQIGDHIVRCVNSHDALVAALRACLEAMTYVGGDEADTDDITEMLAFGNAAKRAAELLHEMERQ